MISRVSPALAAFTKFILPKMEVIPYKGTLDIVFRGAQDGNPLPFLHTLKFFELMVYYCTRIIKVPNLEGESPEGLEHIWETIKKKSNSEFSKWSHYILYDVPEYSPQSIFASFKFNCQVIARIIKECSDFQSFLSRLPETHDRINDFYDHFNPTQSKCFTYIWSEEQGTVVTKTKPQYVYIIPEDNFKALFDQDFEDLDHEDDVKKVHS